MKQLIFTELMSNARPQRLERKRADRGQAPSEQGGAGELESASIQRGPSPTEDRALQRSRELSDVLEGRADDQHIAARRKFPQERPSAIEPKFTPPTRH